MSDDIEIIKNYANALFVSAKKISKIEAILQQLSVFASVMRGNENLQDVMYSPIIDSCIKIRLVNLVADKYKFENVSRQFLYVLIKNLRCKFLLQIVNKFSALIAVTEGIKLASIVSASELSKKEIKTIQLLLEKEFDQKFALTVDVDSSLIGGVILKYDSNLVDCSVQGALHRVRKITACAKT